MVLSTARTGSNQLIELMHNFNNIDVNWDIVCKHKYKIQKRYLEMCEEKYGENYEEHIRKNDLQIELLQSMIKECESPYFVFKIFMGDCSDDENHLSKAQIETLVNDKIVEYVIILDRKNRVDQYISLEKTQKYGVLIGEDAHNEKIEFDVDKFNYYKHRHIKLYKFFDDITENVGTLHLIYECDIYNANNVLKKIKNFIPGLNKSELGLIKQHKSNDYISKINNYNDVMDIVNSEAEIEKITIYPLFKVLNYEKPNDIIEYLPLNHNVSTFVIDDSLLNVYSKTKLFDLDEIYTNYTKKGKIFGMSNNVQYIVLGNCIITNNGLIKHNGKYYYDGFNWEMDILTENNRNIENIIYQENNIISISKLHSSAFYHFTIECFLSLSMIPENILNETKIHIGNGEYHNTEFIIELFRLINIDRSQLIFGNVFATKVYIPKKHLSEAFTNLYCIDWFKNVISKHLNNTNSLKYLVLVKRVSRNFNNFDEVKEKLYNFSKEQNLELIVHDDSNLPSLIEQFNIFNQAKYILAPHGATGILIPAMREKSWYIEFIKEEWCTTKPHHSGHSMARLAYACSINYYMSSSKDDEVSIDSLNKILANII